MSEARTKATRAKSVAPVIGRASRQVRERALVLAASNIREHSDKIVAANALDLDRAREAGMSLPLQDRLMLDSARIEAIAQSLEDIAGQEDPLGRVLSGSTISCGLRIEQVTGNGSDWRSRNDL